MAAERYTVQQVIDAIDKGHTPTGAASVLRCHPDTVRNYADRYPTVKKALLSARAEIVDLAEIGLRAAVVNKEPWAIAFALKTLARETYSERQEVKAEISGPEGSAIPIKLVDYRVGITETAE